MDIIFDFFIEFFLTLFVEGFISLYSVFVPDKTLTKKFKYIMTKIILIISIVLLIVLFVGLIILVETSGRSIIAWIFVSLAVLYIVFGIVLKFISVIKKRQ